MNPYELIDHLCEITSIQADIIRKQQAVIAQHGIEAPDSRMQELTGQAEEWLDHAERELRKI